VKWRSSPRQSKCRRTRMRVHGPETWTPTCPTLCESTVLTASLRAAYTRGYGRHGNRQSDNHRGVMPHTVVAARQDPAARQRTLQHINLSRVTMARDGRSAEGRVSVGQGTRRTHAWVVRWVVGAVIVNRRRASGGFRNAFRRRVLSP